MTTVAEFRKTKDYPLHGRVRTLHEVEHENELLRHSNARLHRNLAARNAIIADLQREIEDLKRRLGRENNDIAEKRGSQGSTKAAQTQVEA